MTLYGLASAYIHAPGLLIWELVSDVERIREWNPETYRAQWLSPATGPTPSAQFRGHHKHRSRWKTTAEVTEAVAGEVFAFRTLGSRPTLWRYELDAEPDGTLVIERFEAPRYNWQDRLAFWLTTGTRDRQGDLVRDSKQTLRQLKLAAEQAAPPEETACEHGARRAHRPDQHRAHHA